MTDILTIRAVEDFLINPTINTTDPFAPRRSHKRSATMNSDQIAIHPHHQHHHPDAKLLRSSSPAKTPQPTGTIRDVAREPIFWHGYTSDEEVASPIDDNDGLSFRSAATRSSASEPADSLSDSSFPEQLAESCHRVEQQCARAHAVQLVQVGKAKVVSMPKVVDLASPRRLHQPLSPLTIPPPVSRLSRINLHETRPSSRIIAASPSPVSPTATPASSTAAPPEIPHRKRHTPLIVNPSWPLSPPPSHTTTPVSEKDRPHFLHRDPYPTQTPPPLTPRADSRKKMRRFSSSFHLARSFRGSSASGSGSGTSSSTSSREDLKHTATSSTDFSPRVPPTSDPGAVIPNADTIPPRTSSRPSQHRLQKHSAREREAPVRQTIVKMVPRGASERAPPLVLPPCPRDDDDDDALPNEHGHDTTDGDGDDSFSSDSQSSPSSSASQISASQRPKRKDSSVAAATVQQAEAVRFEAAGARLRTLLHRRSVSHSGSSASRASAGMGAAAATPV